MILRISAVLAFIALMTTSFCLSSLAAQKESLKPLISTSASPKPVNISSFDTNKIVLHQGASKTVTMTGTNLDQMANVKVMYNSYTEVTDVQATLGPASPTSRTITFKASDGVKAQCCYTLRFMVGGPLPLDVMERMFSVQTTNGRKPGNASFTLNNGAGETKSRSVNLAITAENNPTHFKTNYNNDWMPFINNPTIQLADRCGAQYVRLSLKNENGVTSDPGSGHHDDRHCPPGSALEKCILYNADRDWIMSSLSSRNQLNWTAPPPDIMSDCTLAKNPYEGGLAVVEAKGKTPANGATCNFELFRSELTHGFKYKTYSTIDGTGCANGAGFSASYPPAGGTSMKLGLRLWSNPGKTCRVIIKQVTLTGPCMESTDYAF